MLKTVTTKTVIDKIINFFIVVSFNWFLLGKILLFKIIFKLTINLWKKNIFLDKQKNAFGEWQKNAGK